LASLVLERPAMQGPAYTLVAANGRRALAFRSAGNTDLLSLTELATVFDLRVQEDAQAGGLIVLARGERVSLTPGQPLVSVSGRIVSLSGPVQREGQSVFVPVDFLSRVLGPTIGQRIEVRRGSRLIILGDLRAPQVTPRIDRLLPNARLTVDVQPPAVHRTTRDGNRLVIRFDADLIDLAPPGAAAPEFAGAARVEGPSLVFDLGPSTANVRADDSDVARVVVDLLSAAADPPPPTPDAPAPGRGAAPPTPPADITPAGVIRTIVIDPGHGGNDAGAKGRGGTIEKDLVLQVARRLKATIESRVGLRVLLTRENDESVPIDRRTAMANNNKADLLISLHANASLAPALRGAQVVSLSLDDYKNRASGLPASLPVPVVSGGTRAISAMPWDLAQIPHAPQSASLAAIILRQLTGRQVPLYLRPSDQGPMRVLVGANMPAVLVELGFLSNAEDERALQSGDVTNAAIEALVAAIVEVRNGIPVAPPAPPAEPER
jgi:N-acetylmuramoyl-L-alanine amidase